MGRPLRIEYPGAFYHITSRGNERKPIYQANRDYEKFLAYLESASERYGAQIHCFCLMPNHYHLLLETPRGNMAAILHHINTSYTNYFNAKHGRVGHLFQGRYRAILVEKGAYALELSRYIHLNPVRAELVEEPFAYAWSSYSAFIREKDAWKWLCRDWLLSQVNEKEKLAILGYRQFVEDGIATKLQDPIKGAVAATVLGSEKFVNWVKEKWIGKISANRDIPALKKLANAPGLAAIQKKAEEVFGRETILSKKVGLYLAHRFSGCGLKEIGIFFGRIGPSAVSQNTRRFCREMETDKGLSNRVGKLQKEFCQ
jgi:REP element-mobilizing transposase RayT